MKNCLRSHDGGSNDPRGVQGTNYRDVGPLSSLLVMRDGEHTRADTPVLSSLLLPFLLGFVCLTVALPVHAALCLSFWFSFCAVSVFSRTVSFFFSYVVSTVSVNVSAFLRAGD